MLKPSGGFRKLFSPERMAKMRKAPVSTPRPAAAPPQRANRERRDGVLGRAMERKAY